MPRQQAPAGSGCRPVPLLAPSRGHVRPPPPPSPLFSGIDGKQNKMRLVSYRRCDSRGLHRKMTISPHKRLHYCQLTPPLCSLTSPELDTLPLPHMCQQVCVFVSQPSVMVYVAELLTLARTLSFVLVFLGFFPSFAFFMLSCLQLSHSCPHAGVPHHEFQLFDVKKAIKQA